MGTSCGVAGARAVSRGPSDRGHAAPGDRDFDGAGRCGHISIIAPKALGVDADGPVRGYRSRVEDVVTLFRPTGPKELALVAASGWKRWPPRLPEQPIFYPVTNEAYARQIAERWNVKESGSGFVTRFAVRKEFLDQYERHFVGARQHEEYWIPAEDLDAFNDAITGRIEVIGAYGQVGAEVAVDALLLPDSRIAFGGARPEVPADLAELDLIDVACLTASFVSSISEDYWCASWLSGIGADSYRWAEATGPVKCGFGTLGDTDPSSLSRLRARLSPWWVEWVAAFGGVALVPASSLARS
jgi:hypothetical protein